MSLQVTRVERHRLNLLALVVTFVTNANCQLLASAKEQSAEYDVFRVLRRLDLFVNALLQGLHRLKGRRVLGIDKEFQPDST